MRDHDLGHHFGHDHRPPASRGVPPPRPAEHTATTPPLVPGHLTPQTVRMLQGSAGNRAVGAARRTGLGSGSALPVQRVAAPGFGKRFAGPSIGSESELNGFVCALPENANRTFAFVRAADGDRQPLVQVTKDMNRGPYPNPLARPMAATGRWQTHTVELVTYPSLIEDGQLQERDGAVQFLLDLFRARIEGHGHEPLQSQASADGRYWLEVTNPRHVLAAGTGTAADERPSVVMPPGSQQITMGVAAKDFGTGATPELRLLEGAPWYRRELAAEATSRLSGLSPDQAPENAGAVANVYAYLASVIDFTAHLVAKYRLPMEDHIPHDPPLAQGLTDPKVKNEWRILPRTRPKNMLDTLTGKDLAAAKTLLRTMPARGDAEVWKAAKDYIFLQGGEVAGHGINDASVVTTSTVTEDGTGEGRAEGTGVVTETDHPAALFEFRSVPDELKGRVPHQRESTTEVSDPMAGFGTRRREAVQAINQEVAAAANADEFGDWYRERYPQHARKPTPRLLTLAAAAQKATWLRASRPQRWQDFQERFAET